MNLGLLINDKLTWDDQVSKVCRNVLFTLKRLWKMWHFTPFRTRHQLVTSLIVPQFLYCDVIFSKSTARLRERLKVTFNSCARYIFGIFSPRTHHTIHKSNSWYPTGPVLKFQNLLHHEQHNKDRVLTLSIHGASISGLGKSVCHICADRGEMVIGSESFFVLFFFLNT
jgi:hypothetical protein